MNTDQKPVYNFRTDLRDTMLGMMLSVAVPWRMLEIAKRGGITDDDIKRIQTYTEDLAGPKGTDLFFKSKKNGESAERFNQVADTLAVLAFLPGGIKTLGEHYDGEAILAQYEQAQKLNNEWKQKAETMREQVERQQQAEEMEP